MKTFKSSILTIIIFLTLATCGGGYGGGGSGSGGSGYSSPTNINGDIPNQIEGVESQ
jgi:hypothetical protein